MSDPAPIVRFSNAPLKVYSSDSEGLGRIVRRPFFEERGPGMQQRELKGLTIAADVTRMPFASIWYQPDRRLTTDQLWRVYTYVPDIRAAIDSIVRRIATRDWSVEPYLDKDATKKQRTLAVQRASEVTDFLLHPADSYSWQSWATAICTDLLIYDMGVAEKERAKDPEIAGRQLAQLFPRPGDTFYPNVEKTGRVSKWVQYTLGINQSVGGDSVDFQPDELLILRLFRNTRSARGLPLIESVIQEATALAMSSERIVLSYDANEIPPGLLLVAGLGDRGLDLLKEEMRNLRGRDEKVRIIGSADAHDLEAKWIELRRSMKDLDMVPVVREVRRLIWRTFGVTPIEMGETTDANRTTADVLFEVGDSHLLGPIYELIEGEINDQVMPLLDPDGLVRFRFLRDAKLKPADAKAREDGWNVAIENGTLTRNEVRLMRGQEPIEGGDVATVKDLGGLRLVASLGEPAPEPEPEEEEDDDDPSDGGEGEDGEPASVQAHPDGPHEHEHRSRDDGDLPSDWQPAGRFKDARCLDLPALAHAVVDYHRAVTPLYEDAAAAVVSMFAAVYEEGGLDASASARAHAAVDATISRLAAEWDVATTRYYRAAGENAREAVKRHLGDDALGESWKARADTYQGLAMGWLTESDGLLGTVRQRLHAIVTAISRDESVSGRAKGGAVATEGLDVTASAEAVAEAALAAWATQQARIDNWSGKLVGLASSMLREGALAVSGAPGTDGEVMGEWVSVGDEQMCSSCEREGGLGWRPLSQFSIVPGEGTECRARCRCVIQVATKRDVDSGAAESLSNYEREPDPLDALGET